MMTIEQYFMQAELALAAYGTFTSGVIDTSQLIDPDVGMSASQATAFAKKWSVVAQYTDSIGSVSATVFEEVVTVEAITGIMQAASHRPDVTLETTVQQLADILLTSAPQIGTGDRDTFYSVIQSLQPFAGQNITLATLAKSGGNDGLAYRYALLELNSFAVSDEMRKAA